MGVVCDRCNNGKLAYLDNALIEFVPVSFMRTFHGVKGKDGKLPASSFNNASMHMPTFGNVVFESNSRKAYTYKGQKDDMHSFDLSVKSNRPVKGPYARTIARALFKMTLGCMHIDMPETAMSERFDPVRRMILGLDKFHGYFATVKRVTPPNNKNVASLSYNFYTNEQGEQTVWCHFYFYGVEMFTDLEMRKPKYPELITPHAAIFEF